MYIFALLTPTLTRPGLALHSQPARAAQSSALRNPALAPRERGKAGMGADNTVCN